MSVRLDTIVVEDPAKLSIELKEVNVSKNSGSEESGSGDEDESSDVSGDIGKDTADVHSKGKQGDDDDDSLEGDEELLEGDEQNETQ
jgi:hypothetical protein